MTDSGLCECCGRFRHDLELIHTSERLVYICGECQGAT